MNYYRYSLLVVGWLAFIDSIIKRVLHWEHLYVVRGVIALLLSAGVGYYLVRKLQDEDNVDYPLWLIAIFFVLCLFCSLLMFVHLF